MGIFTKLFKDKSKPDNPDNARLLELLDVYTKDYKNGQRYTDVMQELINGNSFLMFVTDNDTTPDTNNYWNTTSKDTKLKLAVHNLDGLKALCVFTDEQSLYNWAKKPTKYTAMPSKAVLDLCQDSGIARIVINSDQSNIFVIERSMEKVKKYTVEKNTKVSVGTPDISLSDSLIKKLIENFKKLGTIKKAYMYGMSQNKEFSLLLTFYLAVNTEDGKKAVINAVQDAIQNETLPHPLDLKFNEKDDTDEKAEGQDEFLIYKR